MSEEVRTYEVGDTIVVGEFFWIKTAFGFAQDAVHQHGTFRLPGAGSADTDCCVRVLSRPDEDGDMDLMLLRDRYAAGALAPHGTFFTLNVETVSSWPRKIRDELEGQRAAAKRAAKYRSVLAG